MLLIVAMNAVAAGVDFEHCVVAIDFDAIFMSMRKK